MLAVGIDIGGTKIAAGLVDESGEVRNQVVLPTPLRREEFVRRLREVLDSLVVPGVVGIGVGLPGFLDKDSLRSCPNIPFLEGEDVRSLFSSLTSLPVFLENDANTFVLAEVFFGAARGVRDCVGVIVGTGVGCGLFVDGSLYVGAHGGAGEFGHVFMGADGDVEAHISGPALIERYERVTKIPAHRADALFRDRSPPARAEAARAVDDFGRFISMLIDGFNPAIIVLGGGVSQAPILARVRAAARRYALSSSFAQCRVVRSSLGVAAGFLGAAALVLERKGF